MEKDGRGKRPGAPTKEQRESKERQPLPNVWDVMERKARLDGRKPRKRYIYPDDSIRPPLPKEFLREERELNRLASELREKGTPRDKLILELGSYGRIRTRGLTQREEFQKFRAEVELMSDEEIADEIHRRKQFQCLTPHFRVGLGKILP